jgi:hypothetical protein
MSAPTYSFKKEETDEYGVKVETIDYGDISNSTLVRAFGDQMTYNDLEFYAKNEEGCGNLVCVYRWFDEKTLQFRAIHNGTEIFEKSFDRLAMGIELFHILNELETEMETREDEEREEHSSLDLTPESPESPVRRSFGGLAGKAPRKKVVTASEAGDAEEIEKVLKAEWMRKKQVLEALEAEMIRRGITINVQDAVKAKIAETLAQIAQWEADEAEREAKKAERLAEIAQREAMKAKLRSGQSL